jgi:hypothetical protein
MANIFIGLAMTKQRQRFAGVCALTISAFAHPSIAIAGGQISYIDCVGPRRAWHYTSLIPIISTETDDQFDSSVELTGSSLGEYSEDYDSYRPLPGYSCDVDTVQADCEKTGESMHLPNGQATEFFTFTINRVTGAFKFEKGMRVSHNGGGNTSDLDEMLALGSCHAGTSKQKGSGAKF